MQRMRPGSRAPHGGATGHTSSAKADALYQMMLEESGPPCGAVLAVGPDLGALPGQRTGGLASVPAPGRAGKADPRFEGPPMLMSPHQTGLTNYTL